MSKYLELFKNFKEIDFDDNLLVLLNNVPNRLRIQILIEFLKETITEEDFATDLLSIVAYQDYAYPEIFKEFAGLQVVRDLNICYNYFPEGMAHYEWTRDPGFWGRGYYPFPFDKPNVLPPEIVTHHVTFDNGGGTNGLLTNINTNYYFLNDTDCEKIGPVNATPDAPSLIIEKGDMPTFISQGIFDKLPVTPNTGSGYVYCEPQFYNQYFLTKFKVDNNTVNYGFSYPTRLSNDSTLAILPNDKTNADLPAKKIVNTRELVTDDNSIITVERFINEVDPADPEAVSLNVLNGASLGLYMSNLETSTFAQSIVNTEMGLHYRPYQGEEPFLTGIKYTYDDLSRSAGTVRQPGIASVSDNCITRGIYYEGTNGRDNRYITKDVCIIVSVVPNTGKIYYRNVMADEVLTIAISPYDIYINGRSTIGNIPRQPLPQDYTLEDAFRVGEYVMGAAADPYRVAGSTSVAPMDSTKNVAKIQSIDVVNWTVDVVFSNPLAIQGQELLEDIQEGRKIEVVQTDVPPMSAYPSDLSEGIFSLKCLLRSQESYYYNYDVTHSSTFRNDLKGLVVPIGDSDSNLGFVKENNTILPPNYFFSSFNTQVDPLIGFITEVINPPSGGDYLARVVFFRNENKSFIESFELKGARWKEDDYPFNNFPDTKFIVSYNVSGATLAYDNVGGGLVKSSNDYNSSPGRISTLGAYNTIRQVTGSGTTRGNPIFLRQYANLTNLRQMAYIMSKIDYPIS